MRVKATALATLIVLFLPTVASAELNLYQPIEITLTSEKSYNNPYRDIDLNATITPPAGSGEAGYTLPGFWDGGVTFKIRFAPRRPGTYTVITSCSDTSDSGLHNKTFSYTVGSTFNPATPHGFVDRDPTNPYYFRYDDGTPFVWLGDTGWVALYDWGWSTTSMSMSNTEWQAIVDNRKQYGFTVLQVLAYNETVHWNDGQWPYSGNDGRNDNATINPVSWQRMESRAVYALNKGLMLYFMMSSSGTHYCFTAEQRRRLYRYVVARFAAYNVGFGSGEEVNDSSYGCWNDSLSQEMENDMASLQPYRKMFGLHGLPEFELGMGYTDILLFQKTDGGYFGKGQVGRLYGKPYVLGETLYYRPAGGHGTDDPVTIRQSAWETLLGGAAGYTFGQHEHCCARLNKTELTDES